MIRKMLHTRRTVFMTPRFTWLPPDWMPYEVKLYQRRLERMWSIKKSEDAGHAKVPGIHHVNPYRW
jgi:hypothetical protein